MKAILPFVILGAACGRPSALAVATRAADAVRVVAELAETPEGKKPTALTSSRLQRYLDNVCVKRFEQLCKEGVQAFCVEGTAAARKGRGSVGQDEKEWRCYADELLGEHSADVWCTDDCGVLFPCVGSINPQKTVHTTLESLETELVDKADLYCSPQQKLLNQYCTNIRGGLVARGRLSEKADEQTPWRCYDVTKLDYTLHSDCLDNCGGRSTCRGGRTSNQNALVEGLDYFTIEEAEKILGNEHPCEAGLVCVHTMENPAKCVPESEAAGENHLTQEEEEAELNSLKLLQRIPVSPSSFSGVSLRSRENVQPSQVHRQSGPALELPDEISPSRQSITSLQDMLDAKCALEYQWLCSEKKLSVFCDTTAVVARKDMGVIRGETGPVWRCVTKGDMRTTGKSFCVDNCGLEYPCPGHFNPLVTVHAKWPGIESVIEEYKSLFCRRRNGHVRLEEA